MLGVDTEVLPGRCEFSAEVECPAVVFPSGLVDGIMELSPRGGGES